MTHLGGCCILSGGFCRRRDRDALSDGQGGVSRDGCVLALNQMAGQMDVAMFPMIWCQNSQHAVVAMLRAQCDA